MYSNLMLTRFRGFQELHLPELARVNLLSGRNNTGKSAILEALFLLACGPTAGQMGITTLRAFRGDPQIPVEPAGESSPWDELFFEFGVSEPMHLSCDRDRTNYRLSFEIPNENAGQFAPISATIGGAYSREIRISEKRGDSKATNYSLKLEFQLPPIPQGSASPASVAANINFNLNPTPQGPIDNAFLIGSRLRAGQQELASRYSQLRRRGAQHDLISTLQEIEPRLERLEVLVERGQPVLYFDMEGNGPLYPITVLGEGVGSIVDIITSIYLARNGLVLLDEVENGIHHTALTNLWYHIHRAAERSNTQVVATTHSQECVASAYDALRKRPAELKVYRLRRPKGVGDVQAIEYSADSLSGALSGGLDIR